MSLQIFDTSKSTISYLLCQVVACPPTFYGTMMILQSSFTRIYEQELYRSFFTFL